MSFDLCVHTPKGADRSSEELALLQAEVSGACRRVLGTVCTPAQNAPEFIKWFLENDAFPSDPRLKREFDAYCRDHSLQSEPLEPAVAHSFWVSREGSQLARIQCPTRDEGDLRALYASLVALCRQRGLRLVDPQAGHDVDIQSPGELPPGW